MAFSVLKYLGVGYLLFLAWRTLRDRSPLSVDAAPAPRSDARVIGQSGVFMLVTLIVFAGYGLFAAAVRTHVINRPRVVSWMRRVFAGSYAVLASRLALADGDQEAIG